MMLKLSKTALAKGKRFEEPTKFPLAFAVSYARDRYLRNLAATNSFDEPMLSAHKIAWAEEHQDHYEATISVFRSKFDGR